MDPITTELYRHRFSGIAEEMGLVLRRSAFSPNIKERLDFSCALFDPSGRMVAQAAHIPVHLGAMPASVAAAREAVERWHPGDVIMLNDPFAGGTHLPDITLVAPVFFDNPSGKEGAAPDFFVANRAHHADVGGMTPASLPISDEIYQEGVILPPIHLVRDGETNDDVLALFLRNVRTPDERRGDLSAQRASLERGQSRLIELAQRFGAGEVREYAQHLFAYAHERARQALASWPRGKAVFEDFLEWDNGDASGDIRLSVQVEIHNNGVLFDFSDSDLQGPHALNAVRSITESCVFYVMRALLPPDIPDNAGCFEDVTVVVNEGSVLAAKHPAAVAAGNVETSQRIVDLILGALAQIMDSIPAASQGTMNNFTVGGMDAHGLPFAYYETIGGGMGGGPEGPGLSGVQCHMTNTWNTPIEALELAYPLRVTEYALRTGSGGRGMNAGGDGLVREVEFLTNATCTLLTERRRHAPWGLRGGGPGQCGKNVLIHANGRLEPLPGKCTRKVAAKSRLRIETPGGGGWGDA
jgi:N-methylhydantoinase B